METLDSIRRSVQGCTLCSLHKNRNLIVFGEGNEAADLMLVGESPGYHEDQLGRPFIGPAGKLLGKMLLAIQQKREAVYLANIIKCRPPANRFPSDDEADCCLPILRWQVHLVKPQIIVCFGELASRYVISKDFHLSAGRGQWVHKGDYSIMPTFHPTTLLKDPSKKGLAWEDFKLIRDKLENIAD